MRQFPLRFRHPGEATAEEPSAMPDNVDQRRRTKAAKYRQPRMPVFPPAIQPENPEVKVKYSYDMD
jgi:hypothetical protein